MLRGRHEKGTEAADQRIIIENGNKSNSFRRKTTYLAEVLHRDYLTHNISEHCLPEKIMKVVRNINGEVRGKKPHGRVISDINGWSVKSLEPISKEILTSYYKPTLHDQKIELRILRLLWSLTQEFPSK